MIRRKPMNKAGARTLKRRRFNVKLKKIWLEQGVTSCELRLPGCLGTWAMGAAHSKKSRFLITDDDWLEAALSCCHCHQIQEALPHDEGYKMIMGAIAKRGTFE